MMGLIANLKNKVKSEIQSYKYNKALENDPAVVKERLRVEREKVRSETARIREIKQFEQDKKELRDLRNSTGLSGQIRSGLSAVRTHLNNVKKSKGKVKSQYRNPGFEVSGSKSLIMQGPGGNSKSAFSTGGVMGGGANRQGPFATGGVLGSPARSKPKKKRSNDIVIRIGR